VGCMLGFVMLAVIADRLFTGQLPVATTLPLGPAAEGTPLNIGTRLLTNYIVGIQAAGVLLLAAMVGAIAIARRKAVAPEEGEVD
jgi:NADH:ubiquinone oxidoreductase subunit 6 (subunit J)